MSSIDPVWRILLWDQGRRLRWVARETGYTYQHIKALSAGQRRPTVGFQELMSRLLDRPVVDLFLPGAESRPYAKKAKWSGRS